MLVPIDLVPPTEREWQRVMQEHSALMKAVAVLDDWREEQRKQHQEQQQQHAENRRWIWGLIISQVVTALTFVAHIIFTRGWH